MQAKPFEASVRCVSAHAGTPRADSIFIIDLRGEINASAETEMEGAYAQATRHNPMAVLLNFEGVNYISSTGIALIVQLSAQARTAGHRLRAYGLSAHYVEIFQITRPAEFVKVYLDEASALSSVRENRFQV